MVKSYPGAPVVTTITTDIDAGDTSIPIAASDGWITGAGGKPFVVRVHEGTTFEKILCTRSGLTLTAVTRGFDGTTPINFSSGSTIKCVWDADSATEFVEHIDGTETDPHATTLLNENRHADAGLHEFGAALGTPGTPVGVGTAAGAGTGTVPARSDHAHVLTSAVAGAGLDLDGGVLEVAVDDTTLAISGDSLLVKDGGISGEKLASQAVTTAKIAPDAITGGLIADDAVDSEHYVDGSIDTAHIADTAVTNAKVAAEAWVAFTPTLNGWTIGNGSIAGRRQIRGKTVHWWAKLTFGSTTNVSSGGGISPPGTLASADFSGTAKYRNDSTGNVHLGAWHASSGSVIVCKTTGNDGQANVSMTAPFIWAVADSVTVTGTAELA